MFPCFLSKDILDTARGMLPYSRGQMSYSRGQIQCAKPQKGLWKTEGPFRFVLHHLSQDRGLLSSYLPLQAHAEDFYEEHNDNLRK